MQGFDLRREDDVLRGEGGWANCELRGGERCAVFGQEFYFVGAGYVGDGYRHQALRAAICLWEEPDRAVIQFRGACRDLAVEAEGLAQRDCRWLYGAVLRGG